MISKAWPSATVSVVIIAQNEEKMIRDCLESVVWADDILLVDNGSTDKTVEIARRYKARVVEYTTGENFSDWRNKGLKEAKGDWILYLDADERVTQALRDEIKEIVVKPQFDAYAIPRRNFIFGSEFKHSGQFPDYQKRLFKKGSLKRWVGDLHEEPEIIGELGHIKSPLTHLKNMSLTQMVEKTNKWSEFEAKMMLDAHHPPMNLARFASAVIREFWLRMIIQKAYLDGSKGIIYALYQVFSRFVSYAKLWEMQQT